VDAVLYTHPHADHLNGIDDLRAFCYVKQGAVVLYGNAFTMDNITSRFGYALQPRQKCGTSRCCCRKWWMARSNMMACPSPPFPCNTAAGPAWAGASAMPPG
jgi:glyoxylase-like metal-dependent hydrolase (beta-lactamase superfamily II)